MKVILTRFMVNSGLLLLLLFSMAACMPEEPSVFAEDAITHEDERNIGLSIDQAFMEHMERDPETKCLDEARHAQLYRYVVEKARFIRESPQYNTLCTSLDYPSPSPTIRIIQQDGNSGAFIGPGGHIYLYTDLLKAIDEEAQFIPILSHLLICSAFRYDVQKLEHKFSRSFLLDLALGANLNSTSPGADFHAVIEELEDHPYPYEHVSEADAKVEETTCQLDYNIRSYSDFFHHSSNVHLKWLQQFPRATNTGAYAAHLSNTVHDPVHCDGHVSVGDYADFKQLIP